MKSITLLELTAQSDGSEENGDRKVPPSAMRLREIGRDYKSRWLTSCHSLPLSDDSGRQQQQQQRDFLCAEQGLNLCVCRHNRSSTTNTSNANNANNTSNRRMETIGYYHTGDFINQFRQGTVAT
jgi:hypothetical protein